MLQNHHHHHHQQQHQHQRPNVLQNRLPGVTIYDQYGPRNDADEEIHPTESVRYHQYGGEYQSLHVEFPSKQGNNNNNNNNIKQQGGHHYSDSSSSYPFEWIEEQHKLQRQQSWLRRWCFCCFMAFVLMLAKWRSDSLRDGTVVHVLYQQETTYSYGDDQHDPDNDNDNHHLQEILQALEKLDEHLEGDIVLQSTKPKFVEAAKVWRQDLEPPLAVIEAKTQHDVELAVPILAGLAREYDLEFAVRSGGYSPAGYGTIGGRGVVLSVAHLNSLKWGNSTSSSSSGTITHTGIQTTVVIEPGVRVEDFFLQVLDQKGHAGVVADAARVGMGGFIMGGGYGLLSRKYGLGIDNVVRMRVVLTSGIVQDVQQGDDLFWALLGAGGASFGVVTEIEYQVYPCDDMKLTANVRLPLEEAMDFLQKLGDIESTLDQNVAIRLHGFQSNNQNDTIVPSIVELDDGYLRGRSMWHNETLINGTAEITMYWMGDSNPEKPMGMKYLKEHLLPLLSPSAAENVWFYYNSWTSMSRAKEQPDAWTSIWAAQSWNGFLYAENNTPMVWKDIEESFLVLFKYSRHISPTIDLWGGAIADIPNNGTAFPYRQALFNVRLDLLVPKEGNTSSTEAQQVFEQEAALVTAVWPSLSRHMKGSFFNYPMPSLAKDEYPRTYWEDNLERLVELKEQYDPFHVLRYEQSVPSKPKNQSAI